MPSRRKEDAAFCCTPLGYLGAAAPKPVFAYFCLATKVGRVRRRETSPPFRQGLPTPATENGGRNRLPCGQGESPASSGGICQRNQRGIAADSYIPSIFLRYCPV